MKAKASLIVEEIVSIWHDSFAIISEHEQGRVCVCVKIATNIEVNPKIQSLDHNAAFLNFTNDKYQVLWSISHVSISKDNNTLRFTNIQPRERNRQNPIRHPRHHFIHLSKSSVTYHNTLQSTTSPL